MTREDIAEMPREDVLESLEAHGLQMNPYSAKDLAELRDLLVRVMFVSL